ncbi:MAG: hypothetical protein FWB95_02495 [Treponema sp.]|nr:hypothetical protein [Treponema sp.]
MIKFVEDLEEQGHALKGILTIKVFKKGVLIQEIVDKNLIVDGARNQVARLIAGNVMGRSVNRIAFGTNGDEPTVADTAITNAFIRNVKGFSYPATGQVQIDWELPVMENNGMAIMEFGLLTADDTLFARRIRNDPIHKEADISLVGNWTIIL